MSTAGAKTFRIRGVPTAWGQARLQSFLAAHDGCVDPVVKSLAIEYHNRTQTGTATFREVKITTLEGTGSDAATLELDGDFSGLTTLYAPPADDHKVDIVAIPGLGGHAFGSFKERGDQHMWLRDALPHHLLWEHTNRPMARVMIHGYESAVAQSESFQNLEDLATAFRDSLALLMSSRSSRRPLILVAHSLGGLIVKEAVIQMAKSQEDDDQRTIQAVYGIVFFGVPHDGMEIGHLIPMVGNSPNRELVGSLSRENSQVLTKQQREFHPALGPEKHTEVFCFYETQRSATARQDENGAWRMDGPKLVLVTKSSATHCRPWEDGPQHICAINRSHSDMVKFGREDHDYERALQRIGGLSRRALAAGDRLRDSSVKFLVPYLKNPDFVGRSDLLGKVQEYLGFGQSLQRQGSRMALFGLGGAGKSQIAITFVHWIRQYFPNVSVFWVHGGSAELFRKALAEIAEQCQIPGRDDPKSDVGILVRKWLENERRGRWIMVLDNADDEQVFFASMADKTDTDVDNEAEPPSRLSDYIPECSHGSILITTRDKQCGTKLVRTQSLAQSLVEVPRMSEAEAQQLLHKVLGDDMGYASTATAALSAQLEHLPLAIAQAAAFIHANDISVAKYIQLLNESDDAFVDQLSEPFEAVGRDSKTPHAVTSTWIISFQQIQKQNPLASDILSVTSLVDRQGIPEAFIMDYCNERGGKMTNNEITKALGTLKAFSLVTNAKDNTINMHRLVHLVTRKWLASQNKSTEFAEHALKTMANIFPYSHYETRVICREYLPHVQALLGNVNAGLQDGGIQQATLMSRISGYYISQGYWREAEECLKRAIAVQTRLLGKEHNDTLVSVSELGRTYLRQSRLREAEEKLHSVVKIRKRVNGEDVNTMYCMADLGDLLVHQRRWKEAEGLASQVLDWHQRQRTDDDEIKLRSTNILGAALMLQGKLDEAKGLQIWEVETNVRVIGDKHPNTLVGMRNLAITHRKLQEWEEAEKLISQVTDISKQSLGEEHPDTLYAIAELATVYEGLGRLEEAENMLTQVTATMQRVVGEDHPVRVAALAILASMYFDQGRLDEAETLLIWLVEKCSKRLGKEHPNTIASMNNLAITLKECGKREVAIRMMRDCLRGREGSLGPDHPWTIRTSTLLAEWEEEDSLETIEPRDSGSACGGDGQEDRSRKRRRT